MQLILNCLYKHRLDLVIASPKDIHMVPVRIYLAARPITLQKTKPLLLVGRLEAEAEASILLSWSTQDHVSG